MGQALDIIGRFRSRLAVRYPLFVAAVAGYCALPGDSSDTWVAYAEIVALLLILLTAPFEWIAALTRRSTALAVVLSVAALVGVVLAFVVMEPGALSRLVSTICVVLLIPSVYRVAGQ